MLLDAMGWLVWLLLILAVGTFVGIGIGWPKPLRSLRGLSPLHWLFIALVLGFAVGVGLSPAFERSRFGPKATIAAPRNGSDR